MNRLSRSIVLITLFLALTQAFVPAQDTLGAKSSVGVDPVVGRWRWFTNEHVYVRADGTLTKGGPVIGHWKCVSHETPSKYVFNWGDGIWIDTLFLKKYGSLLSGSNQKGHHVYATRPAPSESGNGNSPPIGSGGRN